MSSLRPGTRSRWYHGTSITAAAAIVARGFDHQVPPANGRWYGSGIYLSEHPANACVWASEWYHQGAVVGCRLRPGLRCDDISRVDHGHIAGLVRRWGREICGRRPWTVLPRNKHLTRRDWAGLYAYHLNHRDNHIRGWQKVLHRIRQAAQRSGCDGFYRRHYKGYDGPDTVPSTELVVFDPGHVIVDNVYGVRRADGESWDDPWPGGHPRVVMGSEMDPAAHLPSPRPLPAVVRALYAAEELNELTTWQVPLLRRAVVEILGLAAEDAHAPPAAPADRSFVTWPEVWEELAVVLIQAGGRLDQDTWLRRLRLLMRDLPIPAAAMDAVLSCLARIPTPGGPRNPVACAAFLRPLITVESQYDH